MCTSQHERTTGLADPDSTPATPPATASHRTLEAYQDFMEDCPEPMQITDTHGVIRAANRSYSKEAGHPREELIGKNVLDFGFYVDTRQRDQLFALLKSQGQVSEFEVRLRTESLGEFAGLVSASLIVIDGEAMVMSTVRNVSAMSAAQEALRKSEELLRGAFQASLDPITLSKTDGEFVEINDAFCEQSGYLREEVLGRTTKDIGLWFSITQRDAFLKALTELGSVRAFEANLVDRSGRVRRCLLSARIAVLGGVPMVLTVTKDVTKLMEVEDALRRSEEFFRTLMHDGVDPVGLAEPSGVFVEVNDAFVALIGYSRAEIIGKNATQLQLWTDLKQRDEMRDLMAAHGTVHNYSLTVRRKDGALRHCLFSGRRLRIGGRELLYSSTKDITELRAAEQARRAGENRLRILVETASEGVWIVDADGLVSFVNARMCELLGLPQEQVLGRAPAEFGIPAVHAPACAFPEDGRKPSRDVHLTRPDGANCWVIMNDTPLLDEEGVCIGAVGLFTDISERKQMEEQLMQACTRAEAADKAKSEFLANMSHEIRTPLNGMLGMLQLMQVEEADPDQRNYVSMAVSAGRRLLSLLTDVLDFSKMNAGQVRLRTEPFSITRLFESVEAIFHLPCAAKKLRLSFHMHAGVPEMLLGDEARLRQILFNLVGNAVKFTSSGQVRVEAWARPSEKYGPGVVWLHLTVADTGIGIPEDKIAHVFHRFTQNDGTFTREYEGAGLGLAIVKRIVGLMQGGIVVESQVGLGTTMNVRVLLGVPQPPDREGQAEAKAAPDGNAPLRILLAEDDATSQLAVRVMLQRLGHEVVMVETGRMAVEALKAGDYDCILMDIQMPEMDGVQATRLIRTSPALGRKARIPIIALTAYAMNGDRERFLAEGLDGHVTKPVEITDLERALRLAVAGGPGRAG